MCFLHKLVRNICLEILGSSSVSKINAETYLTLKASRGYLGSCIKRVSRVNGGKKQLEIR